MGMKGEETGVTVDVDVGFETRTVRVLRASTDPSVWLVEEPHLYDRDAGLYGYGNDDWTFASKDGLATDDELATWRAMGEDRRGSHDSQLAHILDCMEENRRPITSGPGVRGTIEFLAALYKSGMTGTPVPRGSIRPGDPFYSAMNGPGDQSWQG